MPHTISQAGIGLCSSDGKTPIKGLLWQVDRERAAKRNVAPKGIVQIVHGASEYVGRYDEFARFLAQDGYVVCGTDHIGHGKSVSDLSELGCMPAATGKNTLMEDVHALRKTVAARYSRQTPYFLFGHSMGSFIVRDYLARYGEGLAGAVVCGTGNQSPSFVRAGSILARFIASRKGDNARSDFLHNLGMGAFSKEIQDPRTDYDWLSCDPAVVDAYIADELCGAKFSAGAYAVLADLTREAITLTCAEGVPKDLPLLFIAGSCDPVGECGKGVNAAADLVRRAGVTDVSVKLYDGMRHEILNEIGKEQVYADVLDWLGEKTRSR